MSRGGLVTRKGAEVLIFQPGAPGNPRADAHMLKCSGCQGTHFLELPMRVDEFVRRGKLYEKEHQTCTP